MSEFSPVCRIVRPTQLRLSRDYILFYSTWTWVGSRGPALYTLHSTLYTLHCKMCTTTLHCTLYTVNVHCLMFTTQSTLQVSLTSLFPFLLLSCLNLAIWRKLRMVRETSRQFQRLPTPQSQVQGLPT